MTTWIKKLCVKKFTDSLGFPLALAAIAHSGKSSNSNLEWVLVALLSLISIVLLVKDLFPSSTWKSFVTLVEQYDYGYVVFGLGLMTGGSAITDNWVGIFLFIVAGLGFVTAGMAQILDKQVANMSRISPTATIVLGMSAFIGGILWLWVRWNEIVNDPLGSDTLQVYFLLGVGIVLVLAGFVVRSRRSRQQIKREHKE